MVARRAHNPKVAGSNPAPATKPKARNLNGSGPLPFSSFTKLGHRLVTLGFDRDRWDRSANKIVQVLSALGRYL